MFRRLNPVVLTACVLGLFIALALAPSAFAQHPEQHGWGTVQALTVGASVTVKAYNEDRVRGRFVKADEDSVVLATRNGSHSFPKEGIEWLSAKRPGNKGKIGLTLVVAAVGVGVGGTVAVFQNETKIDSTPGSDPLGSVAVSMADEAAVELGSLALAAPGIILLVKGRGRVIYWTDRPPTPVSAAK